MLTRILRSAFAAAALAAMLASALPARAAGSIVPDPTCGACQPIGVMWVLILFVDITNALRPLIP